ncbi:AraC family transcriptional regulator [Vibrio sp. E150_011]
MNHAIEFRSAPYELLTITPRKKSLHNQLIRVEAGKVLLKLGKNEYVYNQGDIFWVPFDCLSSLTIFPSTHLSVTTLSIRLLTSFPVNAGQITPTSLMTAILDKLQSEFIQHEQKPGVLNDLLSVLKHELEQMQPKLRSSQESQLVTQWKPESTQISGELALILRIREARKLKLSGIKTDRISATLFDGNEEQFKQLYLSLLGEPI